MEWVILLPNTSVVMECFFFFLSATKLCLIMPQATTSPISPEASRPALPLGPIAETRRYTMGVPEQRTRYSLILPSTTTCSIPRHLGMGKRIPQLECTWKTRKFYLDSWLLLTHSWKLEKPWFHPWGGQMVWTTCLYVSNVPSQKQLSYQIWIRGYRSQFPIPYFFFFF